MEFDEIIVIDGGGVVLCDFCNKDWTSLPTQGGFLFGSKAVCPDCSEGIMANVKKYKEEHFIRGECPAEMPFSQWVLSLR